MNMDLIARFYRARSARFEWPDEVARRAEGLELKVTRDFFFHMNPMYEPNLAMQYVVGRYEAAYDAIRRLRPRSILEIGCAHGLSTWLTTSYAERVVGLDTLEDRVAIGRHMFPEVEWVVDDFLNYLRSGVHFDLIFNSHGPTYALSEILAACDHYIYIGYRTKRWKQALVGSHKQAGRQLSFSTTLIGSGHKGIDGNYWRYYLRRNWLKEARHAIANGSALPI